MWPPGWRFFLSPTFPETRVLFFWPKLLQRWSKQEYWWRTLWMDPLNMKEQILCCAFVFLFTSFWLHNLGYIILTSSKLSILVNYTNHVNKKFSFHCMVLLSCVRLCKKCDIFTWPQWTPVTIFWIGNLY